MEGLKPFTQNLRREVTEEDIVKLTEIRIKRISKFDLDKAKQHSDSIEDKLAKVNHNIANLIPFAIDYFKGSRIMVKEENENQRSKYSMILFTR